MKIIIDANALIYAIKHKVDLQDLLRKKYGLPEIYVPTPVIKEIEKLKLSHKSEDRMNANMVLDMIHKQKKFLELEMQGYADNAILHHAIMNPAVVLTNDVELRFRLKEKGIKVICIRQKNHLEDW